MKRRRGWLFLAVVLILVGAGAVVGIHALSGPSLTPAQIAAAAAARYHLLVGEQKSAIAKAQRRLAISLPTKRLEAAPAIPTPLFTKPLASREVVGFVPYYTLSTLEPSDYAAMSVMNYFGLQIARGGTLSEPTGFVALSSSSFQNFVTTAHDTHDNVLLTISAFSRSVIDSITRHPTAVAALVAGEVAPLVKTYGLQGIDVDIEGRWQPDRTGFTAFIRGFVTDFHASVPAGIVDVDTFPQSAGDGSTSFFNLKKLAPVVHQFLVMAYDMQQVDNASANSPAISPRLGLSVVQALMQFRRLVSPSKLILGMPFYGYDFSTASGTPGAATTTDNPVAVTYASVVNAGRSAYWDPNSETPYTRHKQGTQWHETWYENPVSIALKVALANEFRLAGVGVWALGMEGANTAMLSTLDGGNTPQKPFVPKAG